MKSTAKRRIVWGVAGLVGLGAASAQADTIVQLTLAVNTATNSWSVFELNANSTPPPPGSADTVGLDGLGFDVLGGGGIAVTSALNGMLRGSDNELGATGFTLARTNGTVSGGNAIDISGFQNAGSYMVNSLGDVKTVYTGIGNMAESVNTGYVGGDGVTDNPPATAVFKNAALPVLLATGHYTGTFGTLTVASSASRVALLPGSASFPSAGPGQTSATYQTHSPTAVTGQTVQIGTASAPLPSSALGAGLLVGGLGLVRRLRRA